MRSCQGRSAKPLTGRRTTWPASSAASRQRPRFGPPGNGPSVPIPRMGQEPNRCSGTARRAPSISRSSPAFVAEATATVTASRGLVVLERPGGAGQMNPAQGGLMAALVVAVTRRHGTPDARIGIFSAAPPPCSRRVRPSIGYGFASERSDEARARPALRFSRCRKNSPTRARASRRPCPDAQDRFAEFPEGFPSGGTTSPGAGTTGQSRPLQSDEHRVVGAGT
jgi:hypothetical protein